MVAFVNIRVLRKSKSIRDDTMHFAIFERGITSSRIQATDVAHAVLKLVSKRNRNVVALTSVSNERFFYQRVTEMPHR